MAAATQSLAMAMNLYRDGATNFLDVIVAQSAALTAEQTSVGNRTAPMQASIGLVRVPWAADGKDMIFFLPHRIDEDTLSRQRLSPARTS